MYVCNKCDQIVKCPTHEIDGEPLCIYCDEPELIPISTVIDAEPRDSMLGIGALDLMDGDLDGEFGLL